jgi:hypothetical protein
MISGGRTRCRAVRVGATLEQENAFIQGMGKVDETLDSSNVRVEDEPSTSAPAKLPSRAPKGAQGKRKGRR